MAPLKGDGNDVAVAYERIREIDVEAFEIPGTNLRKDHRGCHGNRVKLERGLRTGRGLRRRDSAVLRDMWSPLGDLPARGGSAAVDDRAVSVELRKAAQLETGTLTPQRNTGDGFSAPTAS